MIEMTKEGEFKGKIFARGTDTLEPVQESETQPQNNESSIPAVDNDTANQNQMNNEENDQGDTLNKNVKLSKSIIDEDLTKLSLVLEAADVSSSFLLTALLSVDNLKVSSESLKAAMSAAKLSKKLAEELKPGPLSKDAIDISMAAISATSSVEGSESNIINGKVILARLQEIKKKQNEQHHEASVASLNAHKLINNTEHNL
jgi:hypothetical protein